MKIIITLLIVLTFCAPSYGQIFRPAPLPSLDCVWTQPEMVGLYTELQAIAATGPVFSKHRIVVATAKITAPPVNSQVVIPIPPQVAFLNPPDIKTALSCLSRETGALRSFVEMNNKEVGVVLTKYKVIIQD